MENERIFTFGKYKGHSFVWVIENDKSYILWCLENVKGFSLTKKEKTLLQRTKTGSFYEAVSCAIGAHYSDYEDNQIIF